MGLSLKLLGEFALHDENGAALSLPTRKTRALLGYLAANVDRPQPRERLMALLWSSFGEKQARHNLNQALLSVRKLTPDGASLLDGDPERVTLRGDAIDVDLTRFLECLDSDPATAVQLYGGPFLEGLAVPDPGFEDWLAATRMELHDQACNALERTTDAATGKGDTNAAVATARRLVALDPLREDGHRRLMRLLRDSGDRAGALRQYQACLDILKKQLHVEPDAATRALYEEIRINDSAAESRRTTLPASTNSASGSPPLASHKPCVAVLPFTNVSGDPEQEYFSDGIAEDIITDLSKFDWLTVTARNASFAFKGQERNLRPIAGELEADFIVSGSVRKAGNRVRITVQLVDARDDATLWAERYDRELHDIFALQDEMTRNITSAIAPELEHLEIRRALGERPENLTAWDYFLQARSVVGSFDKKSMARGQELFKRALSLDSDYTNALAGLAMTQVLSASMGWTISATEDARNSMGLASKALRNNPRNIPALCARGIAKSLLDDVEGAVESLRRATQINPNYSFPHRILARLLCLQGDYTQAKAEAELALKLSPHDTHLSWTLFSIGFVNFAASDYEEAIKWSTKVVQDYPSFYPAYLVLAAAKAESDDVDGAKKMVSQLLALDPEATSNAFLQTFPGEAHPLAKRYKAALSVAGLPD